MGRSGSAIALTIANYKNWSGRILAEFWGFTIAPHKHLWNVLNASMFTGILFCMYRLAGDREHPYTSLLTLVLLIFCVPNRLRMQTYTWIMGTTYVVPLLLFLIYLLIIKNIVLEKQHSKIWILIGTLINLAICLYMENAAALAVGINVLLVIYLFINDREELRYILPYLIASIVGTLIIRMSPGANYRLARDNADFAALSLFGKIAENWEGFLNWTFLQPTVMIVGMGVSGLPFLRQLNNQGKCRKSECYGMIAVLLAGVLVSIMKPGSIALNTCIFTLYTIVLFRMAHFIKEDKDRLLAYLCLFGAGGANLVMLLSPIFDARSSIYTVYLFILFTAFLLKQLEISRSVKWIVCATIGVLCVLRGLDYYDLYHTVHMVDIVRQGQIAYYQDRPDSEEAYILGFPEDSIHSADVIPGDDYHDQYFKEYYYLNSEMEIHFYYLEEYTWETINAK